MPAKTPTYRRPLIDRLDNAIFSHGFNLFGLRVHTHAMRSAMHGAVNIRTRRWGWVCFKLPTRAWGRWTPPYFYVSPDATPTRATFRLGGWGYL